VASETTPATAEAATELMKSMTRLRARLRAESAPTEMSSTWSQLTTLARIAEAGPTTISALAQAEHVRRQSMAGTVARLREDGLISSEQDAHDGRKTLVRATPAGLALVTTIPAAREAWLDLAIRTLLTQRERQTLLRAAEIMNRVADSDVRLAR
jgi:DNA-binding MarR family transcriptional regulator